VLLRFRSLFAALAVGVFLVSVVAAAYPLFLSASENDLLDSAIADPTITRYGMGIAYGATDQALSPDPGNPRSWTRLGKAFSDEAAASETLDTAEVAIFGGVVSVTDASGTTPPTGPAVGRLFAGTDAIDHIQVLSGSDGPGLWLPDIIATPVGVGPGDEIELQAGQDEVTATVDGVYASLYTQPRQGYWRHWNDDIYPCPEVTCAAPPQFILADHDQLIDLSEQLGTHRAAFAWQAPVSVEPPLTLARARELAAFTDSLEREMSPGGSLHRLFRCCGTTYTSHGTVEVTFSGNAALVVDEVEQRIASVQGPMTVLLIAGLAIALAVVAAAAIFVVAGRRVESGVLTIRGWGPVAFGAKTALETTLPAVIGGAIGLATATLLVASVGPDAPVDPSSRMRAAAASLVGTIVSLLVVGVVSGVAFVARHEHRHRLTRALAAVPWELAALAAAWVLARRLAQGGVEQIGGIERPRPAVFLFPLMLAIAAAIVSARIARLALRWSRRTDRSTRAGASWLAIRRLRSAPGLTSLLLVAGILSLTIATAALATVASLRTTVRSKAEVFVGSQVQVQVEGPAEVSGDGDFPYQFTTATRLHDAGTLDDTDTSFDLLAIDPATFAGAASWNDAFSDTPLDTLLERLTQRGTGAVPVVVANGGGLAPTTMEIARETVPVRIVGEAAAFPGASSDRRPLLVVDRAALADAFSGLPDPLLVPRATSEVWIDGPPDDVQPRLRELGLRPLLVITADEVEDIPFIDAVVQTFLVLQVLGFSAVVLLLVVGVVYLHARQRSRAVATTLSDRMGMPRSTMRTASILELGALLLVSLVVGTVTGAVATGVIVPSIDPLPTIPPDPLLAFPFAAIVTTGLFLAVAAILGGTSADRGARRISTAEVMRVAE
jgi:putative ABC transport system permease protein